MDLSNGIRDDITTCNNDNVAMKSAYLCFYDIPLFLTSFLTFINTQIMQINCCAYLHRGMKGLCLNYFGTNFSSLW